MITVYFEKLDNRIIERKYVWCSVTCLCELCRFADKHIGYYCDRVSYTSRLMMFAGGFDGAPVAARGYTG
jgi:hypothetical protein